MRPILTLFALFFTFSTAISAQTTVVCLPNPIYKDSAFGVYPRPFDAQLFPKGGIDKSACIGKPYKYTVTVKMPTTVNLLGSVVPIINAQIAATGAVTGLPAGISYACNPPTCTFEGGKEGCISIQGTANMTNTAKDYDMKIAIVINTGLGIPISDVYPGGFGGALGNGKYTLKLEANSSTNCFVSSVNENFIAENMMAQVIPNPSYGNAQLRVFSELDEKMTLEISDLMGRIVKTQKIQVNQGSNSIELPLASFHVGMYHYRLKNDKGFLSGRILINN